MDENNNITPNDTNVTPDVATTPETTSTDYVIGGPSTTETATTPTEVTSTTPEPVAPATEMVSEAAPTQDTAENTTASETPASAPTPEAPASTADIYEKANEAAINPTAETTSTSTEEGTTIFTTTEPTSANSGSYSVPHTTYASTDSTYARSETSYTNTTSNEPVSNTLAIVSLVCGILSILASCCCCFGAVLSIPGIICGCMQKPMEDGKKPGMATAGIITSGVGIVIAIISLIILIAMGGIEY